MLQELGRILAALVLLTARAIGRAYQGLRYLVRRARQTRSATTAAAPKSGRLLDIAALSVAASVFFLAEMWRRDGDPLFTVPFLIGLCVGAVGAAAIAFLLRGPIVQYALAGAEALRLAAVVAYAFSAPTMVAGGWSDRVLGPIAVGAFVALAVIERALWGVAAPGRSKAAGRYFGFLLIPILLLMVLGLIVGGLVLLIMAQVALFAAMCLAFVIETPAPRVPRPSMPSKVPAQREAPEPDSPDGSYHLYRPNSLSPHENEPPEQ
jgi:hypothetical protein